MILPVPGLPPQASERLLGVLAAHPAVEEVWLYGSRAMGRNREASDVDLTLKGTRLHHCDLLELMGSIDDLLLPWQVDLSLYAELNEDLRAHVNRVGLRLLERAPTEWPGLREVFGDELLASILSISPTSVQQYAAGERRCPDEVTARLHWLAMVVEHLEGSFNASGMRRWFQRSSQALGGLSPLAVLGEAWDPQSAGPGRLVATLRESRSNQC